MAFSLVPWWAYLLIVTAALAFGGFQCYLAKRAVSDGKPKVTLIIVKLGLWLAALISMAVISLPLLLIFVAGATVALMSGMVFLYRNSQKEGR